jgi:hypothetical protein
VEDVIRTHLNAIFFGSLPTTAVQIHQRYSLRNGLPLTHFGSDNHSKKPGKHLVGAGGTPQKTGQNKLKPNCLSSRPAILALNNMFKKGQISLATMFELDQLMKEDRLRGTKRSVETEYAAQQELQD